MPEISQHPEHLRSRISDAVVALVRGYTGRGPMSARTTIDRDLVYVYMQDSLTKGERVLVEHGRTEEVLAIRRTFQEAMAVDITGIVRSITGREVTALMSANHAEPDCSVEAFVLGDAISPV